MSNAYRHVELLTGDVRRRRWTTEQKLTIIEQSFEPGETVSSTARRHGVAPNLLYRWRRLLSEGGAAAVDSDEPVVGNSEVKKLEDRVRTSPRSAGTRWCFRLCGMQANRRAGELPDSETLQTERDPAAQNVLPARHLERLPKSAQSTAPDVSAI